MAEGSHDGPSGEIASDEVTPESSPMDHDPLAAQFDAPAEAPQLADTGSRSEMAPAGSSVSMPAEWVDRLTAAGVNPSSAPAGELVLGLLKEAGYSVSDSGENQYQVSKGGSATFVMVDPYEEGGYPEMDEDVISRFIMAFANSKAGNGIYVTDRFAPFAVYDREKRESRVRFISRERIQQFVNGITGTG